MANEQAEPIDVSDLDGVKETKYVRALKQLQVGRIREEIVMYQKIHDVMVEFQDKLSTFDKKRTDIINGEYEPTEEECKYEFAEEGSEVEATEDKGIPDFWPTIFANLDLFNSNISEKDVELFKYLKNIRYEMTLNPRGFKLHFDFTENEFFSNTLLTKTYIYSDKIDSVEPLSHTQLVIDRCEGTKIEWKSPDKNITEEKGERTDSFFNFFDPPTMSYSSAAEEDQELLNADFDMGETLYSSVIPRAIVYYTGEGIEDDCDYDEEFDEDEDYDDEDEEDEAAAGPKPARRAVRRRGNGPQQAAPECKNQ